MISGSKMVALTYATTTNESVVLRCSFVLLRGAPLVGPF